MKPKYLIIHHTATSRDRTTFSAIKNGHIRRGFGDIGYHFLITADGVLHEGRGQDQVGAYARADRMNFKSLGIALTGNFEKEKPTNKQFNTLKGIVRQLQKIYSIPSKNILGHKEVEKARTLCPGRNLIQFVQGLRSQKEPQPKPKDNLSETVKEQTKEIKRLKDNLIKCQQKCQKKQELIDEFKEKEKMRQNWFSKLFE